MPSKPDEFKSLMLPIYIYNRLKWEANKQNISLDKLLFNFLCKIACKFIFDLQFSIAGKLYRIGAMNFISRKYISEVLADQVINKNKIMFVYNFW